MEIVIEGYTFDSDWLMELRARLTHLYFNFGRVYNALVSYIEHPVELLSEEAVRDLTQQEIFDKDGHLPFDTMVAAHLMAVNRHDEETPDWPLGWLVPDSRPPCEHQKWYYVGVWDEWTGQDESRARSGGPRAFCTFCGDHKRFTWLEWKALSPDQVEGVPGSP